MTQLNYDSSFSGFLTAVFEVYEYKLTDAIIKCTSLRQHDIFAESITVHTDEKKAERVWKGVEKKASVDMCDKIFQSFLSELPGIEDTLLRLVKYIFSSEQNVETDFSHPAILHITQTAKKVHREKHRMEAFVRFQKTQDNIFFALVDPDFNVLPLLISHFKNRYSDQHWIIYDRKRKYGISYNKLTTKVEEVNLPAAPTAFLPFQMCQEEEQVYQTLWRDYFNSVNIAARKNTKLHVQHVPRRYWQYLTEKRV